ncbi:MAG TPA: hypothetical protein VLW52_15025 [Opitutaceae bacterium]|nr:hypothetical protein [Opitutaceae bacterium]
MNNEQAKFILRAYRPNGRDAGDAVFCEALRQAQADPGLGGWLAREQAFDAAVSAKLEAMTPPPGLREAILTGGRVSTAAPRPRWGLAPWLGMAASVAVLIAIAAIYWTRSAGSTRADLDQMTQFALADPFTAHTGPHADKLGALGAWLENPANRISTGVPADLAQLKAQHCRTVSIAGHEVFEICFQRGSWYHLYLGRRSDFAVGKNAGAPAFIEQARRSAVSWADERLAYVLITSGGVEGLRHIL